MYRISIYIYCEYIYAYVYTRMYYPLWPWHLPIESPSHRPMGPIDLPIKVAPAGSPVSDFGILAGSFLYVEWWHCTNLDNSYLPGSGIHIDEPSLCWFLYRKKNDGWIMLDIGCQWNKFCWFNWTGLKIRKSLGETTHIKESLNSIIPVTDSQESHLTTASTLPNSLYKCCKKWSLIYLSVSNICGKPQCPGLRATSSRFSSRFQLCDSNPAIHHPVIKHALLENSPRCSMIFSAISFHG